MTDREMLELAAKAAGLDAVWRQGLRPPVKRFFVGWREWNPLNNDDDAFRLLAKLRGYIDMCDGIVEANIGDVFIREKVSDMDRHLEACRRVITRAAAKVGRASA